MCEPANGQRTAEGIEVRVHGIGDHEVFSALGRPEYKETADDRVWIGKLPRLPKQELRLINWSRASRRISRTITWYLAYPFTMLNVAGYMGPEKSRDRKETGLFWCMRASLIGASLMLTYAMAAWITVILETAWRLLDAKADRFSTVILCGFAPVLLSILIVNRMVRGRPLADKGNWFVSLLTLGLLAGMVVYLADRPADKPAIITFGKENARDPVTFMVVSTTLGTLAIALVMCGIAWCAECRSRTHHPPDSVDVVAKNKVRRPLMALAGASLLTAVVVTVFDVLRPGIVAGPVTTVIAWGVAIVLFALVRRVKPEVPTRGSRTPKATPGVVPMAFAVAAVVIALVLTALDAAGVPIVGVGAVTSATAWSFALVLGGIAWWDKAQEKVGASQVMDRTSLAGAGILIVFAIAILHTAGSLLRLVLQTVLKYTPAGTEARITAPLQKGVLTVNAAGSGGEKAAPPVLLSKPDDIGPREDTPVYDYVNQVLPVDFVPMFFLAMVCTFGLFFYFEYRRYKPKPAQNGRTAPSLAESSTPTMDDQTDPSLLKETGVFHALMMDLPRFLGRTSCLALLTSLTLWIPLAGYVFEASNSGSGNVEWVMPLLYGIQITGLVLVILILLRRPEVVAARMKQIFASLADIAGFWAPDLHPLAGASYRRAVLRGIRIGIQDVREDHPDKPIALVGHSQGSVICAWFVRGGHWKEKRSESRSDEKALAMDLHSVPRAQSDRIALFTCGSPLDSLYRTFFPRYFNDDFFKTALEMSYGNIWYNYLRETDPIGTELVGNKAIADRSEESDSAKIRNIDVTELKTEETKGHGEYWQDDRLRRDVDEYFTFFELVKFWQDKFNDLCKEFNKSVRERESITEKSIWMDHKHRAVIYYWRGGKRYTQPIQYRTTRFERDGEFYEKEWEPLPCEVVPSNGRLGRSAGAQLQAVQPATVGGNGRTRWVWILRFRGPSSRDHARRNGEVK